MKFPTRIHPGIINATFDMLNKEKQHVISVDGKGVTQGLSSNKLGDINLWGLEGPPSLDQAEQHLNYLTQKVQSICNSIDSSLNIDITVKFRSLASDITLIIKKSQNIILYSRKNSTHSNRNMKGILTLPKI